MINITEVSILALTLALAIDLFIGEPPESIHPTVWMGKVAESIESRLRLGSPSMERAQGIALVIALVLLFTVPAYYGLDYLARYIGLIPYLIVCAFLLKTTIAVKSMRQFAAPIACAAKEGNYDRMRQLLRNIVRRDPAQLTDQQVFSATVESIAEGTVDGATGPVFLYSLFGIAGAIAYRVVNTLDSTVGYRDRRHIYIGWFAARLDTVVNYVPARVTGILTIASSWILGFDWSKCLYTLRKDHSKTASLNAGWPMSAMAGALGISLEKPGFYVLGQSSRALDAADIQNALRIMELNVLLFVALVCVPIIVVSRMLVPIV
ncbi:MAG: cobalamin biosynthesis protein [Nitrososphaerota archaeon]|nr:cobalamin biosynthesis protein [Nitrososphaerota archaeon]